MASGKDPFPLFYKKNPPKQADAADFSSLVDGISSRREGINRTFPHVLLVHSYIDIEVR